MANTNSPQFSTYKTVEVKFDGEDMFRTGDLTVERDLQIVNMYYDRYSQENKEREVRIMKRDGLAATTWTLSKSSSSDVLRGSFNDVDNNIFYWSVNDKVYSYDPDTTAFRTVVTLATSSGYVGFCSYLKSTGTRYIIISDGTNLYYDDGAACTQVVDPDLPTPHQPYPLYLDGYVFLIKTGTSDIYNSDNDDPATWSNELISAEINSDWGYRLFKVKNYIVALGYNSVEYFWDAGNVSGSPLSRNDSPVRSVGYITGGVQAGDSVYFVGQDEKKNLQVFEINSFKIEPISTPVVDRTLQTFSSTANSKSNVTLNTDGYIVSTKGHTFYVLVTPQTTWAYEIKDKIWYEWKNSSNVGLKIEAVWGMYNGACYMAIGGQTTFSIMSPSLYQDFGVNFTTRYVTEDNNFGTFNWKVAHRTALNCSMHNYIGTSNALIKWSDNDWADGGTNGAGRNINVFSSSPYITKCGKFRNRSFRIEYADNYPFFMTSLSLDINVQGI